MGTRSEPVPKVFIISPSGQEIPDGRPPMHASSDECCGRKASLTETRVALTSVRSVT